MSKTRNDEQKARRAYLDKCRKDGRKPLGIEAWKAQVANVTAKIKKAVKEIKAKANVKKAVKPAKPVAKKAVKTVKKAEAKRAKVHEVHVGDVIKFVGFCPEAKIRTAIRIMLLAFKDEK